MPAERGIDGTGRKDVVGMIGLPGVGMIADVNIAGNFMDDDDDEVVVEVDMGIVMGIGLEMGIEKKEGIEVGQ